ncbi:uncharacterized protein LOC130430474 isoform X2 [Triplophysa dalaica]|nr:uncharacterized protein LOC130430388 isoform X2 [Triplophysa dalaica]XP_056615459.1 uncharacterized protein LOC130430388 isoform X2 [Triplophysa dalaica]XP_056615460.1 uncharacterized protein LOC130430388 isoform X2 [Triplophysa dalaica]XP_056615566.1 uncharacterized protein LOC130430474 isoform X2 [Triplophysa dalaica]XP_056615567.1 uncharacterized protein LOC130430474 isoform X2 [Triplophysa dalaica]XP_056615568.1 uncharacterized protein LOC130430474 isoform X2 [Triplophysa dalaica]
MEGDSVTLHTNVTDIQTSDVIRWRFGEGESRDLLVDIDKNTIKYNGPFKDRLHADIQTGDLTITNMRIKHSGPYEVQISRATTTYKSFRVNVTVAPSVFSAGDVKSVTEGDSVTLHTDVQTQRDDLILWRFGDDGVLIAKHDKEDNKSSLYDADGRFRDRLKLDLHTGSLIITNTKTTDTGLYKLKISSNRDTKYKTFSVSVSDGGLSSGGVAGIVFGVLLCIVVVVFVFYRINYERQKQMVKEKTVIENKSSVTLESDVTELQSDDVIEWSFRDKVIVIFSMNNKLFTDEQRLRDRLQVDDQTGSLIITNIRTEDAGLYKVKISSSSRQKSFLQFITGGGPSYRQFNVIVTDEERTEAEVLADSVSPEIDVTERETGDVRAGASCIVYVRDVVTDSTGSAEDPTVVKPLLNEAEDVVDAQ